MKTCVGFGEKKMTNLKILVGQLESQLDLVQGKTNTPGDLAHMGQLSPVPHIDEEGPVGV